MKYILYTILFICLTSISCNQSQPSLTSNIKNTKDSLHLVHQLKVNRALKALQQSKITTLPLHIQNYHYNAVPNIDSTLAYLLQNKSTLTALDSLFKYSDMDTVDLRNNKASKFRKGFGQFLTSFKTDRPNTTIALYGFGKFESDLYDYNDLYLIVFNSKTLKLIDKVLIGHFYLPQMTYINEERDYVGISQINISADFKIYSLLHFQSYDTSNPHYEIKLHLSTNNQFIKQPTTSYSYDYNIASGFEMYTFSYLNIENKFSITLKEYDNLIENNREDDNFFYHHLDMILLGSYKLDDTVEIIDHLDRKWLDVFEYKPASNNSSCKHSDINNECNDAHYIHYIYESSDDSIVFKIIEIKYTHLPNETFRLKTRFSNSIENLKYQNWKVITLHHTNVNNEDFKEEVNTPIWKFDYYFKPVEELPYDVTIEKAPSKEEMDLLDHFIQLQKSSKIF